MLNNPSNNSDKKTERFIAKPRNFANSEAGKVVYINYIFSEQLKMYKSRSALGYLTKFLKLQTLQYSVAINDVGNHYTI
jgi:hypothetical protein